MICACGCGAEFKPTRSFQKYLNRKCRDAAQKRRRLPIERQVVERSRAAVRFKGGVLPRRCGTRDYWAARIQLTVPRGGRKKPELVSRFKQFSVKKLGHSGARLAAALTRLVWLIELGLWKPSDGNPFALLSYTDLLKGNAEYADAVVDGELSPWVPHHDYDK